MDEALEAVWRALADPIRRRMLDLLREGPMTTGALCKPFAVSRFAVMKHLDVLESAGLIVFRRAGRERWNHLNAVPIRRVYERWVRPYEETWATGLLRLQQLVEGHSEDPSMAKKTAAKSKFDVADLELRIAFSAPPRRVWNALTREAGRWWPRQFYVGQNVKDFRIEPKLGGRMYEDWGKGAGLIWAQVVGLDPPRSIDLLGHLTATFGGPAMNHFRFTLEPHGKGTSVRISDTVFGRVNGDNRERTRQGWMQLFDQALRAHLDK